MKPTILSLATVLIMSLSAFAGGTGGTDKNDGRNNEINKLAVKAFNKDFVSARDISWEQKENFVRVTFTMNDQVMFAYYNNNGDLRAVVRNIVSDQLPISLLTQLKSDYSGFWITDLFEMASDDQTTYYVTLENADKKIVLNSVDASDWNVYSKFKKTVE
jgi:hypothetical protein